MQFCDVIEIAQYLLAQHRAKALHLTETRARRNQGEDDQEALELWEGVAATIRIILKSKDTEETALRGHA